MTKTADFKIFVPLLKANKGPDGKMRFHGVASSSIKDRHGDTITRTALSEMESTANANMTIFLNHSYDVPEDVAGSVETAILRSHPTDPDIQDLVFDIVVNDTNPRAVKAWEAIDNGTKLGLSIGARIPDGGASRSKDTGRYVIDHVDLLETSIVGVPANPRSWVEYAVKSLNVSWGEGDAPTGEVITRSDGEDGIIINVPADLDGLVSEVAKESAGTGVVMEGIEAPADGTMVELVSEGIDGAADLDLEKAKKPADHTHPHAHEHDHSHEHWNGIVHSHDHAHTHAHSHDEGHTHIDDKQGSEHDHSHMSAYGDNEHPHTEETSKAGESDLTGEELVAHLAEFEAPPPDPDTEDGSDADPAPQEAPSESVPENGDVPAEADDAKELDLQPTLVASIHTNNELMLSITRELVEAKTANVRLEQERDQALALAEKAMSDTSALLTRLAATPMGKRTQVTDAIEDFESLKSVYGETFVDLLKKKD
jgi:HK97 family phage prohead protease